MRDSELEDFATELSKLSKYIRGTAATLINDAQSENDNNKAVATRRKQSQRELMANGKRLVTSVDSTRGGLTKYNSNIDAIGSSMLTIIGSVTKGSIVAKLAVTAFTALAKSLAAFTDTLLESYDQLADAGITLAMRTSDIEDAIKADSAFTQLKAAKFTAAYLKITESSIILSKSLKAGIKDFDLLAKIDRTKMFELGRLGVDTETYRDLMTEYFQEQASVSLVTYRTNARELINQEMYVDSLYAMSSLTGKEVKRLAKERNDMMREFRFAATLSEFEAKGGNAEDLKNFILSLGTEELQTAVKSFFVEGFVGASEETVKLVRTLGAEVVEILNDVKRGKITSGEASKRMSALNEKNKREVNAFAKTTANASDLFLSPESRRQLDRFKDSSDEALAQVNKTKDTVDTIADAETQKTLAETAVLKIRDEAIKKLRPMADTALDSFYQVLLKTVDIFGSGLVVLGQRELGEQVKETVRQQKGSTATGTLEKERNDEIAKRQRSLDEMNAAKKEIEKSNVNRERLAELNKKIAMEERALMVLKNEKQADTTKNQDITPESTADSSANQASVQGLLDLIAKFESRGLYNIQAGGKIYPNLESMTVAEVLAMQKDQIQKGSNATAIGKYQIKYSTLKGLVQRGYASLDDKYDRTTQEKLGRALLEGRGLERFLRKPGSKGSITADEFADKLSMEWAALPYNTGRSYYDGNNGNRSHVSREEVMRILKGIPKAATGAVLDGPASGYVAELHGNEAVIPLVNDSFNVSIPDIASVFEKTKPIEDAGSTSPAPKIYLDVTVPEILPVVIQTNVEDLREMNESFGKMSSLLEKITVSQTRTYSTNEAVIRVMKQ